MEDDFIDFVNTLAEQINMMSNSTELLINKMNELITIHNSNIFGDRIELIEAVYHDFPKDDEYASDKKGLEKSRKEVLKIADWIIPGHGRMYRAK